MILIFIKIEEIIESIKIIINTFSPTKELIIASKAKTITSVKHKLICPTADNRSLFSFDSIIIFCIEVLIEVSYTFSKLSLYFPINDTVMICNNSDIIIIEENTEKSLTAINK